MTRPYAAQGAHIEQSLIISYAQGSLEPERFVPVERHLDRCATCRGELARGVDSQAVQAGWERLSVSLDVSSRSLPERVLLWLGVPEHMARLAMATPLLRRSWLVASLVTLLFTVVAARLSPGASATMMLIAAPLIPSAGVALSYGPSFDPMYELGLVMPTSALRLILLRSTTVLIASTALSALVALALPGQGLGAFGWLAPSLALTFLTLALSAFLDPLAGAEVTGAGWLAAVFVAGRGGTSHSALLTLPGQCAVAALALLGAAFIAAQRHRFQQALRVRRPNQMTV